MLTSLRDMIGFRIKASDGDLGHADDFYFDDHTWMVRYVVVNTGTWLAGREVLISSCSMGEPRILDRHLSVSITMDQVRNSPGIETDLPVSRQEESDLARYYGWGQYWLPLGGEPDAGVGAPPVPIPRRESSAEHNYDPCLRSAVEVRGYHIQGSDAAVGHVYDYVVDTESWHMRYFVIDTRNWLPGRKVLIAPSWVESVNWPEQKVHVNLSRDAIRKSPQYEPSGPPAREYEEDLHEHYGKPGYWEGTKPRK